MPRRLTLSLALTCLACNALDDPPVEEFEDEGALCLRSQAVGDDEHRVTLTVTFPTCLSSSCSHVLDTQCAIMHDGDALHVTSSAAVEQRGDECTADCGSLTASCQSEPLPAGEYTLHHGADSAPISVPAVSMALFEGNGFHFCPQ